MTAARRASPLPGLDGLLRHPAAAPLLARHGRAALTGALRAALAERRGRRAFGAAPEEVLGEAAALLDGLFAPRLRPVFNLTGTVLHTNLGRALLPEAAVAAAAEALARPVTLEYDLADGRRGRREAEVAALLCRITGAEAASVVNNNAAALVLLLAALAPGAAVAVSRGELIEIGGSFRLPEIMAAAGARLAEVGTTNRTHAADYEAALGAGAVAVLRVHPSNFAIHGFTAAVRFRELAALAHGRGALALEDLGSGALVDLARFGLPHERMAQESLAEGADVVCFSADKLTGGPQAGILLGRAEPIARLERHPLKRALRLDKARLAALAAVLRLYLEPERLAERLPTLRLLARPGGAIRATAERLRAAFAAFAPEFTVEVADCASRIGSGARPEDLLPSAALRCSGGDGEALAARLRALAVPVIGRIAEGALWLDCRTIEAEAEAALVATLVATLGQTAPDR